jgi:hypothetical protein
MPAGTPIRSSKFIAGLGAVGIAIALVGMLLKILYISLPNPSRLLGTLLVVGSVVCGVASVLIASADRRRGGRTWTALVTLVIATIDIFIQPGRAA